MLETTVAFRAFLSLCFEIQAITCNRRGSDNNKGKLEKLLSSYLKVATNAKITPNFTHVFNNLLPE